MSSVPKTPGNTLNNREIAMNEIELTLAANKVAKCLYFKNQEYRAEDH